MLQHGGVEILARDEHGDEVDPLGEFLGVLLPGQARDVVAHSGGVGGELLLAQAWVVFLRGAEIIVE